MPLGEQANQQVLDDRLLANNNLGDLLEDGQARAGEALDGVIVFSDLRRTFLGQTISASHGS